MIMDELKRLLEEHGFDEPVLNAVASNSITLTDMENSSRDDIDHVFRDFSFRIKKNLWLFASSLQHKGALSTTGQLFTEGISTLNNFPIADNVSSIDLTSSIQPESLFSQTQMTPTNSSLVYQQLGTSNYQPISINTSNQSGPSNYPTTPTNYPVNPATADGHLSPPYQPLSTQYQPISSPSAPCQPPRQSVEQLSPPFHPFNQSEANHPNQSDEVENSVNFYNLRLPAHMEAMLRKIDEQGGDLDYDALLAVVRSTSIVLQLMLQRVPKKLERSTACTVLMLKYTCLGRKKMFPDMVKKRINNARRPPKRKLQLEGNEKVTVPEFNEKLPQEITQENIINNENSINDDAGELEIPSQSPMAIPSEHSELSQTSEIEVLNQPSDDMNADEIPEMALADAKLFTVLQKQLHDPKNSKKVTKSIQSLMEDTFTYRMTFFQTFLPNGRSRKVLELMPLYQLRYCEELIKDMGRCVGYSGSDIVSDLTETWLKIVGSVNEYGRKKQKKGSTKFINILSNIMGMIESQAFPKRAVSDITDNSLSALCILAECLESKKGGSSQMIEIVKINSPCQKGKLQPFIVVNLIEDVIKQAWIMTDALPFIEFENVENKFHLVVFSLMAAHFVLNFSYAKSVETAYRFLEFDLLKFGKEPKATKYKNFKADIQAVGL